MAHPLTPPLQLKLGGLRVWIIPLRSDNYTYFISRGNETDGFIVDPSESTPLLSFLKQHGLTPRYTLLTHHHEDHIQGAESLREIYQSKLVGSARERARLPKLDIEVSDEKTFTLNFASGSKFDLETIPCPGHTFHHVSFFLPEVRFLFCGDVMFGLGCGRVFEGTMKQMYDTLQRLVGLTDYGNGDVSVFCGHEYTRSNLKVWEQLNVISKLDPVSQDLRRDENPCTIPLSLRNEKRWNPLLTTDFELFQERRKTRNNF